ncbi:MAG: hypothetical protein L0287_14565 [Anaerolineae bacterium]|nr:hypothetical protein [Anaerolineae bacterium]
MRSTVSYNKVFSQEAPINVWPKIVKLHKSTDDALDKLRPNEGHTTERFLRNWRHITCFLTVSRLMGKFDFSITELIGFDVNTLTNNELANTWNLIRSYKHGSYKNNGWRKKEFILGLCESFSQEFNIGNFQIIEKSKDLPEYRGKKVVSVDKDFALKVHSLLPPQPWKPGLHREISKKLKCTTQEYFIAVQILIADGLWNRQKDGVVYDVDGNVIDFDPERVDPDTMMLFDNQADYQDI